MLLRKTQIGDVDRIMEILTEARSSLQRAGIDQWQKGYPYRTVIECDMHNGESYVVEDSKGNLVATAMIGFRGEDDHQYLEKGKWLTDSPAEFPTYAIVHRVAVSDGQKGKGIASFILESAEQMALENGFMSIRIETHADNTPMKNLLNKEGYQECGVVYITHESEPTTERSAFEKLVSFEKVIAESNALGCIPSA